MIAEEKDRLECLRLAVSFLISQKAQTNKVLSTAQEFYDFIHTPSVAANGRPSMQQISDLGKSWRSVS